MFDTNLDRTPPKLSVSYSKTEATNENVEVTITSNEPVKDVEGWQISEDKMTLKKTFKNNETQNLQIQDLAGNKATTNVDVNNIDKQPPIVQCISIANSNTQYPQYANSQKEINLTIKVTDNLEIKNIDTTKTIIKLDDNIITPSKVWTLTTNTSKEKIYKLKLTNIQGNGQLVVTFENGFATDTASNKNTETTVNTNITIDNIKPTVTYSQEEITQGKIKAKLNADEKVRQLDGWDITSDLTQLSKEFVSNVSYELTITDLAGNSVETNVNVTGATYFILTYASHNSNIGWTFGYGNYDVAGSTAVKASPSYKTEALAFNLSGNVDKDFVKARSYIYTYWGVGSQSRCKNSGMVYKHGYNPSSISWKTMNSTDLVTIQNKKYFQFGGSGINQVGNTDIGGNNPIPQLNGFFYGICGITLGLKDYTNYSIVYQIYVSDVGWVKAASNEEETIYQKDKPMSAFRVAIIPNSEKQNLLNTWNKDIGQKIK